MTGFTANKAVFNTLLTALTPVIWGSTYIVTTEWLPPDRPFTAALIRCLPAGLLLILWSRAALPARIWPKLLTLSLLNIGIFQALLFVAAYRLPGGIAAVVGAIQPLLVMLLAWSIDHNRPALVTLGAGLASILGMSLLFVSPDSQWDPIGLTAAAAGTGAMALGTFLSRRWQTGIPLLAFSGWQLFIGGLFLAPVAMLVDPPLPQLTPENLMGYGYLTIFGALIAYTLWFRGIKLLTPTSVSALGLLSPLTALILGWVVLDQFLDLRQMGGILTVLIAITVLQWQPAPKKLQPQKA
ncbi:DMT family transporter [Photobacterium sp. TY1-4]|uniref:DMT family transporter n=1 Tax=Photobacterium sp. TY1-4 TaxID=2899122 RepID=UPI0021C144C4|nr:DMT family transporter [Photobacterium sp. TY1-4]UXI03510.1 DMT family transporter [Photobacterium sp. TY1-4]